MLTGVDDGVTFRHRWGVFGGGEECGGRRCGTGRKQEENFFLSILKDGNGTVKLAVYFYQNVHIYLLYPAIQIT